MKLKLAICITLILNIVYDSYSQTGSVLFYNVENLFDCKDDPNINDDDFLPQGVYRWSYYRYMQKIESLTKVIVSIGWEAPVIIGLCEIENRSVLEQLTIYGPLAIFNYNIVHYDSPDSRGIDVAMLYRDGFELLESSFIPVSLGNDSTFSRDILYAKGIWMEKDTLHLYVNHWPSKRGGELASEWKRLIAAELLKESVCPLLIQGEKVLIMGDFNDTPNSKVINDKFLYSVKNECNDSLINLMQTWIPKNKGTYFFENRWECIDQFIVSSKLLSKVTQVSIVKHPFMMKENVRTGKVSPFRTFIGYRYQGGYSDHLPIRIDL